MCQDSKCCYIQPRISASSGLEAVKHLLQYISTLQEFKKEPEEHSARLKEGGKIISFFRNTVGTQGDTYCFIHNKRWWHFSKAEEYHYLQPGLCQQCDLSSQPSPSQGRVSACGFLCAISYASVEFLEKDMFDWLHSISSSLQRLIKLESAIMKLEVRQLWRPWKVHFHPVTVQGKC